jgi:hypothetical protein
MADFFRFVIGDQYSKSPVFRFRPFSQQQPLGQKLGRIHRYQVIRHFCAAFIRNRLRIDRSK